MYACMYEFTHADTYACTYIRMCACVACLLQQPSQRACEVGAVILLRDGCMPQRKRLEPHHSPQQHTHASSSSSSVLIASVVTFLVHFDAARKRRQVAVAEVPVKALFRLC